MYWLCRIIILFRSNCILCIVFCEDPDELLSTDQSNDSVPTAAVGYDDFIPVQGNIVMFGCSSGFELVVNNSAICTDNGKWEPDPSQLMCNASNSGHNILCIHMIT